jgi:hypothetical protein
MKKHQEPSKPSAEREVQVPTDVATMLEQKEQTIESK